MNISAVTSDDLYHSCFFLLLSNCSIFSVRRKNKTDLSTIFIDFPCLTFSSELKFFFTLKITRPGPEPSGGWNFVLRFRGDDTVASLTGQATPGMFQEDSRVQIAAVRYKVKSFGVDIFGDFLPALW